MKRLITLQILILAVIAGLSRPAHAAAALLLEEPFGHLGALTATGHAAVYLSKVCASSPVVLRRCNENEEGVVISRYRGIAGYDWVAIPLIPYLYAVESPDQVPLFANAKLEAFLRNHYRRKYLESVAPDAPDGEPPGGNWVQLVGAAYDRTIYSYEIETSEDRDNALIRELNSRPNNSHFSLLTSNCADFARSIINFYYPKTLHRNLIADLGITSPKQLARLLVKYNRRHEEVGFSSFVIPQVPGTIPRSTPVYGGLESILKSKKYLLPLAFLHPAVTAGLAVAYLGTGRFDPAKQALVADSQNQLHSPIDSADRRTYEGHLNALMEQLNIPRQTWRNEVLRSDRKLTHLQAAADPGVDSLGRPVLKVRVGTQLVDVGVSRGNILSSPSPPLLAQEILASRLQDELRRNPFKTSEADVVNDWNMLKQAEPVSTAWTR